MESGRRPPSGKPAEKQEEPVPYEHVRRQYGPSIDDLLRAARNQLTFVTILTNRVVPEKSKIKLSCVVQGPDPNCRWMKNDAPVAYSQRIKNLSRDQICALEINDAIGDDSGDYTLIVRNQECNIQSSCTVQVYQNEHVDDSAPTFTRNLKHLYHLNTNDIYLDTHVHGYPRPTIEWFKDCVAIDRTDTKYTQIDHLDGTLELIINVPNENDSGKFVCKASNRAGDAEISHPLIFDGKGAHIINNRHRSYHADHNRVERARASFLEFL